MGSENDQTVVRWYQRMMGLVCSRTMLKASVVMLAAVAFVMVAARYGKWLTVQQLAHRVRVADDAEAGRLVKELAVFGRTAYPALVVAANSERSAVALAARGEVDELVDRWHQATYLNPATFDLAGQALPLAAALECEVVSMPPSGRRWARRVLTSLLRLAEQQSLDDRLALVTTCDRALSSLPADEPPPQFEPDVEYHLTLAPPPGESTVDEEMVDVRHSKRTTRPAGVPHRDATASDRNGVKPPERTRVPSGRSTAPESALSDWDADWKARPIGPPSAVVRGAEAAARTGALREQQSPLPSASFARCVASGTRRRGGATH